MDGSGAAEPQRTWNVLLVLTTVKQEMSRRDRPDPKAELKQRRERGGLAERAERELFSVAGRDVGTR